MSFQGKLNVYICERRCGNEIITKDRDEGVTPFMVRCDRCSPTMSHEYVAMTSSFYRVDQTLTPTHEWIKPTDTELAEYRKEHHIRRLSRQDKGIVDHISKEGLLLRKINREQEAKKEA